MENKANLIAALNRMRNQLLDEIRSIESTIRILEYDPFAAGGNAGSEELRPDENNESPYDFNSKGIETLPKSMRTPLTLEERRERKQRAVQREAQSVLHKGVAQPEVDKGKEKQDQNDSADKLALLQRQSRERRLEKEAKQKLAKIKKEEREAREFPPRPPIQRPPAQYTNTTPMGIANDPSL